ncbi:MAG TPA: DUF1801 domain-containing protein [Candidatus Saccharimonadales bacterium]|nr:DUF1801 domain-containing protein [Candidatus Saccharimonadales bacterium]
METDTLSIEDFFTNAGDREEQLRQLDDIIQSAAPSLQPQLVDGMFGKMLGYGNIPYQTKSMKKPGMWPLIALAAQKNHISIYACVILDGQYIAEKYESKLGKVNCGKSCIRFKKLDDLDLNGLQEMLTDINQRFEAGEKLYDI